MARIDLTGPLLKLHRAKVHIAALGLEIEEVESSTPHEIQQEQQVVDPREGCRARRIVARWGA
jgi:hypothetical protein